MSSSSSTFTPSSKISSSSNPRDWAYELACLPQSASIVFTKESLLAFLKTHNIDISPNYTEINKLPRYAQIGTMSTATTSISPAPVEATADRQALQPAIENATPTSITSPAPAPEAVQIQEQRPAPQQQQRTQPSHQQTQSQQHQHDGVRMHNPEVVDVEGNIFRPTRRVREPIGGGSAQISALFGGGDDAPDYAAEAARESARRRGLLQQSNLQPKQADIHHATKGIEKVHLNADDQPTSENTFRPTRRVREPGGTGGASSISLG